MVPALNPTLSYAFRESARFSCGCICCSTELASSRLDFRLRAVGRLRNFVPSFVVTFFPLLRRFVRGTPTHHRCEKYKTKRGRNASHRSGFYGG
jgi:hypothetical protein